MRLALKCTLMMLRLMTHVAMVVLRLLAIASAANKLPAMQRGETKRRTEKKLKKRRAGDKEG